jgi:hypothetical protein
MVKNHLTATNLNEAENKNQLAFYNLDENINTSYLNVKSLV